MKYANLHLHSIYSDGLLTPKQLVYIGKSLGYSAIALADHETDGGFDRLSAAANAEGLEPVAGIEFYGMYEGLNLHLTALDYDMDNPTLRALVNERCELRYECTKKRFELGKRNGYVDGIS